MDVLTSSTNTNHSQLSTTPHRLRSITWQGSCGSNLITTRFPLRILLHPLVVLTLQDQIPTWKYCFLKIVRLEG